MFLLDTGSDYIQISKLCLKFECEYNQPKAEVNNFHHRQGTFVAVSEHLLMINAGHVILVRIVTYSGTLGLSRRQQTTVQRHGREP